LQGWWLRTMVVHLSESQKSDCWHETTITTFRGSKLHCFSPRVQTTVVVPLLASLKYRPPEWFIFSKSSRRYYSIIVSSTVKTARQFATLHRQCSVCVVMVPVRVEVGSGRGLSPSPDNCHKFISTQHPILLPALIIYYAITITTCYTNVIQFCVALCYRPFEKSFLSEKNVKVLSAILKQCSKPRHPT